MSRSSLPSSEPLFLLPRTGVFGVVGIGAGGIDEASGVTARFCWAFSVFVTMSISMADVEVSVIFASPSPSSFGAFGNFLGDIA